MRPRAIVLSALGADSLSAPQRQCLEQCAQVRYVANLSPLPPAAFVRLVKGFDFVAITRRAVERIDRSVIDALPGLKGLSVYSTGVEWIDTDYLRRKGIRLEALPAYCTNAVAESALGLVLMTAHKLHLRYLKSVRRVPEHVSLRGFELSGSTVGIIGYGKIGQRLAQKIRPLCAGVLVNDCSPQQYKAAGEGVSPATKAELLGQSRFVVVCASQSFRQRQLLKEEEYRLIGPGTVLINVARTSLLDHGRLIRMTRAQQIHAYVYDDLCPENELSGEKEYGKVIPTGHTAWYTDEAIRHGAETWIENLVSLCLTNIQAINIHP